MGRKKSEMNWRLRFGTNLKIIMRDRGYDQRSLAEAVGVNESTISRYCAGSIVPSGPVITKIASVLRCDPTDLI